MTDFYKEIYKLKNLTRKGWLMRTVKDPTTKRIESDAEHTFSMCLLALEILEKEKLNLNTEKVLKMCLYHELGEIDVGDITPFDHISKQEKFNKEEKGVVRISELANMPEVYSLWLEFEQNETEEAKFVKKMDKLDTVMQAKIYAEKMNKPEIFEEFYNNFFSIIQEFKKYI